MKKLVFLLLLSGILSNMTLKATNVMVCSDYDHEDQFQGNNDDDDQYQDHDDEGGM